MHTYTLQVTGTKAYQQKKRNKKKIQHTGSHGEGTKAYEQPDVPVQLFDVSFFFLPRYLANVIQIPIFQEKNCLRSPISLISSGLSNFAVSLFTYYLYDSTTYLLYLIYYWWLYQGQCHQGLFLLAVSGSLFVASRLTLFAVSFLLFCSFLPCATIFYHLHTLLSDIPMNLPIALILV